MSSPELPLAPAPVVLVTGAAKRLGRAIALELASQGWRVAVHYRDSVDEARRTAAECGSLTAGAQAFRANLGNEAAVRSLLPKVVDAMGQVDALVNCAAGPEREMAIPFSFAAMEKQLRSNVGAAILLAQALHAHTLQRQQADPGAHAVVINLLGQWLWSPASEVVSDTLSKAALEAANTLLAQQLQPAVSVFGIEPAPGTEQAKQVAMKLAEHRGRPLPGSAAGSGRSAAARQTAAPVPPLPPARRQASR